MPLYIKSGVYNVHSGILHFTIIVCVCVKTTIHYATYVVAVLYLPFDLAATKYNPILCIN